MENGREEDDEDDDVYALESVVCLFEAILAYIHTPSAHSTTIVI